MMPACDDLHDDLHARVGHVVAVWKDGDATLLWGGYRCKYTVSEADAECFYDPAVILCHDEGEWVKKTTRGLLPPETSGATAQVVGDELYVICGIENRRVELQPEKYTNSVYRLNLNTWVWTRMEPEGTPPLRSDKLSSWVYEGSIYVFGGYGRPQERDATYPLHLTFDSDVEVLAANPTGWNNQLVRYDVATNRWHWPKISSGSCVPSSRATHATTVCGDRVFLFGGRHDRERKGDLYSLDLKSVTWTMVHGDQEEERDHVPCPRSWHSLTAISDKAAVLYGGYSNTSRSLGDCWLLRTSDCQEIIWTRCFDREELGGVGLRLGHQGVQEPGSKRVWLVGGLAGDIAFAYPRKIIHAWNIKAISFSSNQRLKLLALESVATNYDVFSSKDIEELPQNLQRQISAIKKREKHSRAVMNKNWSENCLLFEDSSSQC
jgi:hypothetical protein